ncbi:MAG: hypothetical protein ACXACR_07600 [Candidatus Hodarchaeales archaeon]
MNIILTILSDRALDPKDILKIFLKYIFQVGYPQKYETIGLVSSEGFPIWVSSEKEMDEFLFAISITSLLSLVERIDMEVAAEGVKACIIQGTENLLLNVAFNPSQDLALAVTRQGEDLSGITLDKLLKSLFQKIIDPFLFNTFVPEITDEDREQMLEEIRQTFEGETTEEEIQTLNVFDTETLKSLENEIKNVAKKYGANEISIGYLRKRMKLPAEVLSMALQYLIGEGNISGRLGIEKPSEREILVLNVSSEINEEEKHLVEKISNMVENLFLPINSVLSQLPTQQPPEIISPDVISEALGEFQVMLSLADSDPLFLLATDIRILSSQLENSVNTMIMVENQITETEYDDVLREELDRRHLNLKERISEQRNTVFGKATKFYDDILTFYRLLLRLLPVPEGFRKRTKRKKNAAITFKCISKLCDKAVRILDTPQKWVKLYMFSIILGVKEDFPPNPSSFVVKQKTSLENLVNQLSEIESKIGMNNENSHNLFLENLDELLISNSQIDEMISKLRKSKFKRDKANYDYYSLFSQCSSCNNWYCEQHMFSATKCKSC